MSFLKKSFSTFAILGVIVGLILGSLFYFFVNQSKSDIAQKIIIEILPGMALKQVATQLQEKQIVANATAFRVFTYLQGKESAIKAGEYELSANQTPKEILERLTQGRILRHKITVPEGYNIEEIAQMLESAHLASAAIFIEATKDPELIDSLGVPIGSLEGYLFPDTYLFRKNIGEEEIVKAMVENFRRRILEAEEYKLRLEELDMTFHQIITLASIIEKETGQPKERVTISSVFHNRLRKNMLLQSDPTVIYALKDFDGNIRKKDLSTPSPYNTYKTKGLPPGPIASPGVEAVRAALYPTPTDYLFFVAKKNGYHKFSKNLRAHNKAVFKYQISPSELKPRSKPAKQKTTKNEDKKVEITSASPKSPDKKPAPHTATEDLKNDDSIAPENSPPPQPSKENSPDTHKKMVSQVAKPLTQTVPEDKTTSKNLDRETYP